MSSLSALNPGFRLNAARLAVVTGVATVLVLLGFLVPFWIVLTIATGMVLVASAVRAVRAADRKIDQILTEELGQSSTK